MDYIYILQISNGKILQISNNKFIMIFLITKYIHTLCNLTNRECDFLVWKKNLSDLKYKLLRQIIMVEIDINNFTKVCILEVHFVHIFFFYDWLILYENPFERFNHFSYYLPPCVTLLGHVFTKCPWNWQGFGRYVR